MSLPFSWHSEYETKTRKTLMALGEFVLEFAAAESQLLETLRVVGKVPKEFSRAALGGVRAEVAMQYVNRLFEIKPPRKRTLALYHEVFPRFRAINSARNLILHYGISEEGVSTDKSRALTEDKARSIPVSPEILAEMIEDLIKINAILTVNLLVLQKRGVHPTDLWNVVRRPWSYTPPPPNQQKKRAGQQDRDSRAKRARPPKSSPK
jgi:hypothetical protein